MSLASLGKKLNDIARENNEILDNIRKRKNEHVICGYSYHLDYKTQPDDIGGDNNNNNGKIKTTAAGPWKFKATPVTKSIEASIELWEYSGEKLRKIEDVFNDEINYKMKTFSDVTRLNAKLCITGDKYVNLLGDRPIVRKRLAILIDNMEKVRSAINEIQIITSDAKDEISDGIENDMKAVSDAMQNFTSKLQNAKMSLSWKVRGKKYAQGLKCVVPDGGITSFDGLSLRNKATLKGHKSNVREVIYYEENGKPCLASCSLDKTIILWSLVDNTAITTLTGHTDYIYALVKFEGDGGLPHMASGSRDKTIKLWDLTKKMLLATLSGHTSFIYSLATYQLHGVTCLASGSWDKSIKIWNVSNIIDDNNQQQQQITTPLSTLSIETYDVYTLKYLLINDDTTPCLAFGGADETIKIWDLTDNHLRTELKGHCKFVWKIETFTSQNILYLISAGGDGKLMLWNLVDNSHVTSLEGHSSCVSALTLVTTHQNSSSDGLYLVSGDDRGLIKFWNLNATSGRSGVEVVKEIDDNLTPVESLTAFHLDKKIHFASSCYDIDIYTLTQIE